MNSINKIDANALQRDFGFGHEVEDFSYHRENFSSFYKEGSEHPIVSGATQQISNLIDHWEGIPKYCVPARIQHSLRSDAGTLNTITKSFVFNGQRGDMTMRPARIEDPTTHQEIEYFPTQNDEVIERVLLKLFTEENQGTYAQTALNRGEAIVRFRLRDIGRVLKSNGITRNRSDIKKSLYVMAGTTYTLKIDGGKPMTDRIISSLIDGSDNNYWTVRFSLFVSASIAANSYRQFPFTTYVQLKSSISRWLLTRMSMQKNFGPDVPHHFKLSQAIESGVVNSNNIHHNLKHVRKALEEMGSAGVIDNSFGAGVDETPFRKHGKLVDMKFSIPCNKYMLGHAKAANARRRNTKVFDKPICDLSKITTPFV